MYLRTLGSEQNELGWAMFARALKFPKINLPAVRLPPVPRIPSLPQAPRIPSPPRIEAPRIPSFPPMPKIPNLPKIDVSKPFIQVSKGVQRGIKDYSKGVQRGIKDYSKGVQNIGKELQKGVKNLSQSFNSSSMEQPQEQEQPQEENLYDESLQQENITEETSNMFYNQELEPTEEPTILSPQESEEMLGALSQSTSGLLNTGFSLASSFFPGASMLSPVVSSLLKSNTKKPAKKPNLSQFLKQPKPISKPISKPIQIQPQKIMATKREIQPQPIQEKKSDNMIYIIGAVGILAVLMMKKKR